MLTFKLHRVINLARISRTRFTDLSVLFFSDEKKKSDFLEILLPFHLGKEQCYLSKYNTISEDKVLDLKGFTASTIT